MVALPQYTQEVPNPDLRIVPKTDNSGRMTNTEYGVYFIDETKEGFEISIMFNEDRVSEHAYQEVLIPYSEISLNDLKSFLKSEIFARKIADEGGITFSPESQWTKMLGSWES